MRKLMILFITLLIITLSACSDRKIHDESISVLFYVGSGGSFVETYKDLEEGSLIQIPEEPSRRGFDFVGWYKDIDFKDEWDFASDTVYKTIMLYAKWERLTRKISFVLNTELMEEYVTNEVLPETIDLEKDIYLPLVKRPGGSFKGWIVVPSEEYTLDMTVYRKSSELLKLDLEEFVLYPVFNNNKYMITYLTRMTGVSTPAPKTGVEYGSIINWLPTLADTETSRFVGWFTKNGTNTGDWGIHYENGDFFVNTNNTTLYAKWEDK